MTMMFTKQDLAEARAAAFKKYGRRCRRCGSTDRVYAIIRRPPREPLIYCEVCNQKRLDWMAQMKKEGYADVRQIR